MKHCRTFKHLSVIQGIDGDKLPAKHRNFEGLVGMVSAHLGGIMDKNSGVGFKKILVKGFMGATLAASLVQLQVTTAFADKHGGSDGGTNTHRMTKEPVEFQNAGNWVRIDPRKFEGIYDELLPKIRTIEEKIPGLGKELEAVLDQRSWFITDREFTPRNSSEEQPINQDDEHVFLTGKKINEMSHEQLKRAWLHEMVRRLIQDGHPEKTPERGLSKDELRPFTRLTQAEIDQLVEKLTVVLYREYDMPARKLGKYINDVLGNVLFSNEESLNGTHLGYLSRPEIDSRIHAFQLKEKYLRVCKANNLELMSLSQPTTHFKSLDCLTKVADVKTRDAAHTYVQECLKPNIQSKVLTDLNALRDEKIETDWHSTTQPFQASSKGAVWNDGYDTYAHRPMNRYGSLDSLIGIGFFEVGMSASIAGKIGAGPDIQAQMLDDSERVVGALQSCLLLPPEGVAAIMNAASDSENVSSGKQAVTTLNEAFSALRTTGTPNPASDARVNRSNAKPVSESSMIVDSATDQSGALAGSVAGK